MKKNIIAGVLCFTPFIVGASMTDDLSTAATSSITGILTVLGTIFVAAFAIPVGKKIYGVIKSALGAA